MTRYRVYLTITGQRHSDLCVVRGCGSWGEGETPEEARRRARAELRETFGSGYTTRERLEECAVEEEGSR